MHEGSNVSVQGDREERKFRFEKGEGTIIEFKPEIVKDQLDQGKIISLIAVFENGKICKLESPKNPIKILSKPHNHHGKRKIAAFFFEASECGCLNNRKCYGQGNTCTPGSDSCGPNTPPCSEKE